MFVALFFFTAAKLVLDSFMAREGDDYRRQLFFSMRTCLLSHAIVPGSLFYLLPSELFCISEDVSCKMRKKGGGRKEGRRKKKLLKPEPKRPKGITRPFFLTLFQTCSPRFASCQLSWGMWRI